MPYDENPWSPEEMDSYRKPKRVWVGMSPKESELVTRGAVDRACCPDCWRWHLDGFRNTTQGHCWSCNLENQSHSITDMAWSNYLSVYCPKSEAQEKSDRLGLKGAKGKGGLKPLGR